MKLATKTQTPVRQLKNAAVDAALSALGDDRGRAKNKPTLTGPRAVATGVVLYTAGRAVFGGRRSRREQPSSNQAKGDEKTRTSEKPNKKTRTPEKPNKKTRTPEKPNRDQKSGSRTGKPARSHGSQPSLELPQQRWPRMASARR